jgi:A/G-specific adenine glycosylase
VSGAGVAITPPRRPLLSWYRARERAYPWRTRPSPYRVLVSEVMLQQTQAPRVVAAYRRFLRRFPTLRSLATAPTADVLLAWAGLGYNRRALALAEAARAVVEGHGGRIPRDPEALRSLPGVGPYTAAAVASIGFGLPVPAVDTNVRRIVGRVFGLHGSRTAILDAAERWLDRDHPGAWNQALMDLGREVCRPRPACERCPLAPACRYALDGSSVEPSRRKAQRTYEGSSRQARGAVVRVLRDQQDSTLGAIVDRTGLPAERVLAAIDSLASDRLVTAGPAALAGRSRGRVRLGPSM